MAVSREVCCGSRFTRDVIFMEIFWGIRLDALGALSLGFPYSRLVLKIEKGRAL